MQTAPRLGACLAGAILAAAGPAPAGDPDAAAGPGLPVEALEQAADWIAEQAEEFDPAEIEWPTEEDWLRIGRGLEAYLESGSLDDLAWLLPYASEGLAWLEEFPNARPYAAWLRGRLAYFEFAGAVARAAPPPAPPAPPPPTPHFELPGPLPRPPRPAPVTAATAQRRSRLVADHANWKARIPASPPAAAAKLVPELKSAFAQEGIPPELVWMAEVESSFDPSARSPAGAAGLFQFMPATAGQYGLRLKPRDERLAPRASARAAARYLRALYARFGSWPLALAAYNAGEGRVEKALRQAGARTFEAAAERLPTETRMYVPRVLTLVELREGVALQALPPPRAPAETPAARG